MSCIRQPAEQAHRRLMEFKCSLKIKNESLYFRYGTWHAAPYAVFVRRCTG